MSFTFGKNEKLKSKRIIDSLFTSGRVIAAHPVKVIWTETELPADVSAQFGVSVPKRRFKKAVDRNKIKRQLREAIRLEKGKLTKTLGMKEKQLALMVLYTGKDITAYNLILKKITEAFDRLIEVE